MTEVNLGALLQNYKANSEITLLDPGWHTVEIAVAKAKVTAAGPSIALIGKVAAGPQAGARIGLGSLSFSNNSLWVTFPILKGLGITDDFIQQANSTPDPFATIAGAIVGRVAELNLNVEDFNGGPRNKIVPGGVRISGGVSAPPAPATQPASPPTQPPLPPQAPPAAPAPVPESAAPVPVPVTAVAPQPSF